MTNLRKSANSRPCLWSEGRKNIPGRAGPHIAYVWEYPPPPRLCLTQLDPIRNIWETNLAIGKFGWDCLKFLSNKREFCNHYHFLLLMLMTLLRYYRWVMLDLMFLQILLLCLKTEREFTSLVPNINLGSRGLLARFFRRQSEREVRASPNDSPRVREVC